MVHSLTETFRRYASYACMESPTHLPWKNLANLRVIDLKHRSHRYGTTEILDRVCISPAHCSAYARFIQRST